MSILFLFDISPFYHPDCIDNASVSHLAIHTHTYRHLIKNNWASELLIIIVGQCNTKMSYKPQ